MTRALLLSPVARTPDQFIEPFGPSPDMVPADGQAMWPTSFKRAIAPGRGLPSSSVHCRANTGMSSRAATPAPGSIPTQRPITGHDTPTTEPIPRPHWFPTFVTSPAHQTPTVVRYRNRLRYNRSCIGRLSVISMTGTLVIETDHQARVILSAMADWATTADSFQLRLTRAGSARVTGGVAISVVRGLRSGRWRPGVG